MNDRSDLKVAAEGGDVAAAEQLGLSMLGASVPFTDEFHEGVGWLCKAADAKSLSAQLAAGQVFMQHPMLDDAAANARRYFEAAAGQGDHQAVERLADLHLFGYGFPEDATQCRRLYAQLAAQAFPPLLCQLAYLEGHGIGGDEDQASATTRILRACAQGHTVAFALAGLRYEQGLGAPGDGVIGAAWWLLAQARKFPDAKRHLDRLAESGVALGEAQELAEKLKNNLRGLGQRLATLHVAETDPAYLDAFHACVLENFAALDVDALSIDPTRRGSARTQRPRLPHAMEALAWSPRVFRVKQFVDEEEIALLIDAALPVLRNTAEAVNPGTAVEVDAFDGDCAIFPPFLTTPVMRAVVQRFANAVQIPQTHFEPLSVLRYDIGNEYTPHLDCFDGPRMEHYRKIGDLGGQRLATCLAYLVSPQAGGATRYLKADLTVDAAPGDAIIHYNAHPDGTADPDSLHQGLAIDAGEKWLARTAVREAPLYGERYTRL